jgi:tetratricopeptide (TPR) repeat protein
MNNLSKVIARGTDLARKGDLAGARAEFEKAARDHGQQAEPWVNLSSIHGMQGNFSDAMRCAQKAIEIVPDLLQGWVNLAYATRSLGDLNQAAEAFRRARRLPGCPPQVAFDHGLLLAEAGKWEEAAGVLGEHCVQYPDQRDATFVLAKALFMKGEPEKAFAVAEAYCGRHPGDAPALARLGFLYHESERTQDAWRACDQAVSSSPDDTEALWLKAELLMFEGRFYEARETYEKILEKQQSNPDPELLGSLSNVCRYLDENDAAIAYARSAVRLYPRNLAALFALCNGLLTKDPAEARQHMERAEAIAPNHPQVKALKARVLEFEGDKIGAWECVRPLLESGNTDTFPAIIAAEVAPEIGKTEEVIPLLERLAERSDIPVTERTALQFTLARLCDKAKQYDRAFSHAVIANKLKQVHYIHEHRVLQFERQKAVYTRDSIGSLPRSSIRSGLPVFIVGMPRSGTSLMEQILSCHSKVYARGETTDVGDLAKKIDYYPDGVRNLSQAKLDALASEYIQRLRELDPSASRFTDKMPGNYLYIGLISQVFPDARIINCRRDPRDICVSQFMLDFATGHYYSYNLETLAGAIKIYQDIMAHWHEVLPIPILDVRYEDLIADPRTWVGKILDFCGLEWEEACLAFHKSKRQITTASYDQVRQPLYTKSVARWKNYEKHLEPVRRILGLSGNSYT